MVWDDHAVKRIRLLRRLLERSTILAPSELGRRRHSSGRRPNAVPPFLSSLDLPAHQCNVVWHFRVSPQSICLSRRGSSESSKVRAEPGEHRLPEGWPGEVSRSMPRHGRNIGTPQVSKRSFLSLRASAKAAHGKPVTSILVRSPWASLSA